ncbi:MAG: hypothetical protein FWD66_08890 [Paludibacter sp.]|nr:hypothetical protein [Paludibacter sp.]
MVKLLKYKTLSVVLTTALFFPIMVFLSGCNEKMGTSTSGIIEIKNFQKSECLNKTPNAPVSNDDNSFDAEITFMSQNSLLHIDLNNIRLSCCMEKIDYEVSTKEENIIINLIITPPNMSCNCDCPYNLNFDIANLAFGSYVVKIQVDGQQLYDDISLIYDSNTNQTNPLIMN